MALAHGRLAIGMVTTDCADPSGLAAFWAAALGTTVTGDYGEFVMLAPPPGGRPGARIPAGARGAGEQEPAASRPRRGDRRAPRGGGAARRARRDGVGERGGDAEGLVWTTLTDPEGNEFCVAEH